MLYADLGWSWVHAASSFAGVAGILAAFTISAIILVLSIRPQKTTEDDSSSDSSWHRLFYAYLVALYSFISSALLFADITGDLQATGSRSYFTGTFAGTMMAIAVVQLLLAIIWSGAYYAPKMSLTGAKALFAVVTALAGLLAFIDNGDFFTATSQTGAYWLNEYPALGWVGIFFLVVLPAGIGMFARKIPWNRDRVHNLALWLSASVITVLIAAVSVLREVDPTDLPTTYTPSMSTVVMAMVGVCLFFFTLSLPEGKEKGGRQMTQASDSMDLPGPTNSAETDGDTPPERPKYVTSKTEKPPLIFGPERVHYAYSVSLPLIHLTFVSIVQGFVLALLLQSFPLPTATSVASITNFVAFVGAQHAYLPYVISGLLVVLIWKQFVQASIILIWPLSIPQITLMLLISLMEVIAFREITHFSAWLAGLGLVAIIGGFIRLNNIRVSSRSYFASESLRRTEDASEWRSGILYILLGILVDAGAVIIHILFDGAAAPFVTNVEWSVLGILSCLMVVVILIDRYDLFVALRDGVQDSDLKVDHFGGVSYGGENYKDTQSR